MDESLEREAYEESNSVGTCIDCHVRLTEREEHHYPYRVFIECPLCKQVYKEIND
jgi:hypothetical protein